MIFDFKNSVENSMTILDFKITEKGLSGNDSFMMAWGIVKQEALDKLIMAKIIYAMRKKYNVSDFEFELLLEGFDEDRILEDD